TPTATYCALSTQTVSYPFENRQVVVVEPSHQTGVQAISDAGIVQTLAHAIEMSSRLVSQEVKQFGSTVGHVLHGRIFGVEHPQGVAVHAPTRFFVEHIDMLFKMANQRFAMRLALFSLAQRV